MCVSMKLTYFTLSVFQLWDRNKRRSISRSLLNRSRGSYVNTSAIFHKCHVYNNTMGGARLYLCRSTSMNAIWVHTLYMYCVLLEYTLYMYCVLFKCRALAFVECLVDNFTIMHYSDHSSCWSRHRRYKNNVTKVTWRTNTSCYHRTILYETDKADELCNNMNLPLILQA